MFVWIIRYTYHKPVNADFKQVIRHKLKGYENPVNSHNHVCTCSAIDS